MLHSAEESLATRDPVLRGLRMLLDDELLGAWVSQLLERETRVRRRHLRYKPGTSCIAHVDADGQPLLVSAHRPVDRAKHSKTRERAGSAVIGTDPELGVLVGTPAADRDLSGVTLLSDVRRRPQLLERLLATDTIAVPADEPVLLRYKPHRRWVGVLPFVVGRPVLLRAYRRGADERAAHALAAFADVKPRTPRLLGRDRRSGVLAVEFLPGRSGQDAGAPVFEQVGTALAQLHLAPSAQLPQRSLAAETVAARAASRYLGHLLPELAVPAALLAEQIGRRLGRLDVVSVPVHGDFSADQAVIGPDGEVALIDLDCAGLGDPAADLGCAAAALARDVVLGELSDADRAVRLAALHAGYRGTGGPAGAERVAVHTAAHLLRRTLEPFRLGLTDDWPRAARDLLAWAGDSLTEPTARGA